jgi:O-acetylhomoserine (thiol)-lyase
VSKSGGPKAPKESGRGGGAKSEGFGFETRSIHAGAAPDAVTGARQTPIHQNTSYVFYDADHAASLFNLQTFGFIYSRLTNPTVAVLEERLASLEGGRGTTCTASGHAAQVLTFFAFMQPGDEFLASTRLYGGSITQFGKTFKKFDWHARFVDVDDPDAVRRALTPGTKALFVESLANPGGVVSDLEALAAITREAGIPLVVDNTMATPYLCRPMEWGADLVVHSTTKFLSGNGTSVGGAVVDSGRFDWNQSNKFASLSEPEPAYHGLRFTETFGDMAFTTHAHAVGLRDLGATMAPMNAFLTLLGTETLAVRMERHCANALKVAEFLSDHDRVSWVSYAGLPSDPYHRLAEKYLPRGAGSVFTFGVRGGYEAGLRVVENVNLLSHLANIGDTRSLILHPASTTHRQLSDEQRTAAGAGNDVIRLSIGLETVEDVIADLDQALRAAAT